MTLPQDWSIEGTSYIGVWIIDLICLMINTCLVSFFELTQFLVLNLLSILVYRCYLKHLNNRIY
jgi:hypothetical protein